MKSTLIEEGRSQQFRTIMESVPNGLVIAEESGRIVLCNSETERLFGYARDELLGQYIEVLVPSRHRQNHPAHRNSFSLRPEKRQMGAGRDLAGVRKDGIEIPVEIGLNHMQTDEGSYVVAAIVDITERKKQETKFRTIVESVPNGLVMVNNLGEILLCNSELERMFGYSKNELLGKKIEVLVPQRYQHIHPGHRAGFEGNPQKRQMGVGRDLTGLRKDGVEIPVEIGLNPMQTGEGNFVLASIADITERKKIDDRLHKAYDEVQQKNEEMEQFVYTVSHDLKAPLVTSMSFIGFLRQDLADQRLDDVLDSLDRLEKAHRRMQELIGDLLQISRVGRLELHLEPMALKEVLLEIKEDLEDKIIEKKVSVVIPDDLPLIFADRRWIHQVFENLISNALKYAESSAPLIRFIHKETESHIQIAVKDNGPGIEKAYHKKIFGLFQRLSQDAEGTGVGLTIVLRVMQLHGGDAWVESPPEGGAEFWVSLPKQKEAAYG